VVKLNNEKFLYKKAENISRFFCFFIEFFIYF